jgi:hypothetical protein
MTELDVLKRAETYIKKLAKGINPLTDEEVREDTVVNEVRLSRCFFYIGEVLEKLIKSGGEIGSAKKAKPKRTEEIKIDEDFIKKYSFKSRPVSLSVILQALNSINPAMKKIKFKDVSQILYDKGILVDNPVSSRPKRVASDSAAGFGIYNEQKISATRGEYTAVLYNEEGQRKLLEMLRHRA